MRQGAVAEQSAAHRPPDADADAAAGDVHGDSGLRGGPQACGANAGMAAASARRSGVRRCGETPVDMLFRDESGPSGRAARTDKTCGWERAGLLDGRGARPSRCFARRAPIAGIRYDGGARAWLAQWTRDNSVCTSQPSSRARLSSSPVLVLINAPVYSFACACVIV